MRMPGVVEHSQQQPYPETLTAVHDCQDFAWGQHTRVIARLDQADLPTGLRLALGDVVKERPPRRPAASSRLPACEQFTQFDPVQSGVLIEGADSRLLSVLRCLAAVVLHRRQHGNPAGSDHWR